MVDALRGRSAAYESLGKREPALGDLSTLVLLCEQELSVRRELKVRLLSTLLEETARAHRDRARLLADLGRRTAAESGRERATELETEARKLASTSGTSTAPNQQGSAKPVEQGAAKPVEKVGWVRLLNSWKDPVTVDLDGVSYTLSPGQEKKLQRVPGPFTYTVRGVASKVASNVEAGEMVTIKIYPPKR